MSNPYTGTVASALRKSQLLLATDCEAALQRSAVQEAAVLQLWRAYRAFLAELAYQLHLDAEPESAQALLERAHAFGKSSGEAAELHELAADPDSWLARLQAAWVALWSFSADQAGRREAANLIPVQNLSATEPLQLTDELLHDWYKALSELVRRQRAQTEEW
ncbi:hypothetical protein SAMN04487965_0038 [Microbulbifer donghaiensis]|uniref:PasA protein n=1 Tax=Microbulbifer donghaiensis TaxID=494016 RepID=A0A1M4U1Z3_9GAMM|nr:DUF6586 family protein [Microbulbifer donghaiensis]SHE50627.1 hypothetical protein SAMN04487965_0038 [Microbulbifer donghaiensis]